MTSSYEQKRKTQEEYYNQTASHYDRWHVEPKSARIVDGWNFDNLKKYLTPIQDPFVLDLACGTGRLLGKLSKLTTNIYGLDQSEGVLSIARHKYPKVDFAHGEVTNLPYDDDLFDVVVVNGSLHHFFALDETLLEINRVLKPGGLLAILGEPNKKYYKLYNPFFYIWVATRIMARIYNLFKKPAFDTHEIEPEAEEFTISQLTSLLGKANFLVKDIYCYDYLPRTENRLFLAVYTKILTFEHRTMSRWLPGLGSAIQCFAVKNRS